MDSKYPLLFVVGSLACAPSVAPPREVPSPREVPEDRQVPVGDETPAHAQQLVPPCRAEWFPGPPDISAEGMVQHTVDPQTGELGPAEPMPSALAQASAIASLEQSRGLEGAVIEVHRVYPYADMRVILPEYHDTHYAIGVDVEFALTPADDRRFDPDDVELIDARTGENLGGAPQIERLSAAGELEPWDDPTFEGSDRYRILFVFPAPRTVTHVCLGYWGQRLATQSSPVRGEGPVIPLD